MTDSASVFSEAEARPMTGRSRHFIRRSGSGQDNDRWDAAGLNLHSKLLHEVKDFNEYHPAVCSHAVLSFWDASVDVLAGSQGLVRIQYMDVAEDVHAVEREIAIASVKQGILQRLKDLHEAAIDEGMRVATASEVDFRRYVIGDMKPAVRPAITLLENGNVRALWRDSFGQQVGLQFRGDGWVQYVLFAKTYPERSIETSVGRKKIAAVLDMIEKSGLKNLIYA